MFTDFDSFCFLGKLDDRMPCALTTYIVCRFILHTSRWPQLSAFSLAAASALPLAPILFFLSYFLFVKILCLKLFTQNLIEILILFWLWFDSFLLFSIFFSFFFSWLLFQYEFKPNCLFWHRRWVFFLF